MKNILDLFTRKSLKPLIRLGDVVEVLNRDGEEPGNLYFCEKGARGRVISLFGQYVKIDINGVEGLTKLANVMKVG